MNKKKYLYQFIGIISITTTTLGVITVSLFWMECRILIQNCKREQAAN